MQANAFRLGPGADLKRELKRYAQDHDLRAAFVLSCVGSLSTASVRMPGATSKSQVVRTYEEPLEIISLNGTMSMDGEHLHLGFSTASGECFGGHLEDGCIVRTTAELVLCELSHLEFHRAMDKRTGFPELTVHPRLGVQ